VTDTLNELIRDALSVYRDAAPAPAATPSSNPAPRTPVRVSTSRTIALVCAAIVVLVGGLYTFAIKTEHTVSTTPITPSRPSTNTSALSPAAVPATSPLPAETGTAEDSSWQPTTGLNDAGATAIGSVAAGPNGFIMIGYAGAPAHAGWFSPDGVHWNALPTAPFAGLELAAVQATSTAFYMLAYPTPVDPDTPPKVRVLRSTDAVSWAEINPGPGQGLAVIGDQFLRIIDAELMVSTDATSWQTATVDGITLQADSRIDEVGSGPGRLYALVTTPSPTSAGAHIIESTDGASWTVLPDPPAFGSIVGTNAGVVVVSNPVNHGCVGPGLGGASTTTTDAAKQCTSNPAVYRLRDRDTTWTELTGTGLPPVAAMARPIAVGDVVDLPVVSADGALTLYESSDGAATWSPAVSTPFLTKPLPGGALPILVFARHASTTIIAASRTPFEPSLIELIRTQH
jgi:hypothetical protein